MLILALSFGKGGWRFRDLDHTRQHTSDWKLPIVATNWEEAFRERVNIDEDLRTGMKKIVDDGLKTISSNLGEHSEIAMSDVTFVLNRATDEQTPRVFGQYDDNNGEVSRRIEYTENDAAKSISDRLIYELAGTSDGQVPTGPLRPLYESSEFPPRPASESSMSDLIEDESDKIAASASASSVDQLGVLRTTIGERSNMFVSSLKQTIIDAGNRLASAAKATPSFVSNVANKLDISERFSQLREHAGSKTGKIILRGVGAAVLAAAGGCLQVRRQSSVAIIEDAVSNIGTTNREPNLA